MPQGHTSGIPADKNVEVINSGPGKPDKLTVWHQTVRWHTHKNVLTYLQALVTLCNAIADCKKRFSWSGRCTGETIL